jgi:hypothetical protein
MAKRKGGHCTNRDIVNVDNELFSPDYDFEGDSGGAWYEYLFTSRMSAAMCGSGICMGGDVKRWNNAMDRYISKEFRPQIAKTRKIIGAYTGGAPPTIAQQEILNRCDKLLRDWKEFQKKDVPWAWRVGALMGHIKSIIRYFDRAACLMDELNDMADELGASHIANRAPVLEPKPPPDGGSWIRGGGVDEAAPSKGFGVLGWVAIGAAGYFGFKVLTE